MTIRPCKFYIMDPATGDAAIIDKFGYIADWCNTWEGAKAFDTKADAATALFENYRLDHNAMAYRVVTEI